MTRPTSPPIDSYTHEYLTSNPPKNAIRPNADSTFLETLLRNFFAKSKNCLMLRLIA